MMTVRGRVQFANGVVHLIAEHLLDETELLNSVGGLEWAPRGGQNQPTGLTTCRECCFSNWTGLI